MDQADQAGERGGSADPPDPPPGYGPGSNEIGPPTPIVTTITASNILEAAERNFGCKRY